MNALMVSMKTKTVVVETFRTLSTTLKENWTICSPYKKSPKASSEKRWSSLEKTRHQPPQKISLVFLLLFWWVLWWVTLLRLLVSSRRSSRISLPFRGKIAWRANSVYIEEFVVFYWKKQDLVVSEIFIERIWFKRCRNYQVNFSNEWNYFRLYTITSHKKSFVQEPQQG